MKERKVRVLRIIGQCKTGGTETIALNYYKHLNHKKIAMDFLFYGNSLPRFNEVLSQNGDSVINVINYSDNLIESIKQIRDVVQNGCYDIVHAQLNTLNLFPLLGAYLGGAKIRIAANQFHSYNLKYEPPKKQLLNIYCGQQQEFSPHTMQHVQNMQVVGVLGSKSFEKEKSK